VRSRFLDAVPPPPTSPNIAGLTSGQSQLPVCSSRSHHRSTIAASVSRCLDADDGAPPDTITFSSFFLSEILVSASPVSCSDLPMTRTLRATSLPSESISYVCLGAWAWAAFANRHDTENPYDRARWQDCEAPDCVYIRSYYAPTLQTANLFCSGIQPDKSGSEPSPLLTTEVHCCS
jgi:hypothetical protein